MAFWQKMEDLQQQQPQQQQQQFHCFQSTLRQDKDPMIK